MEHPVHSSHLCVTNHSHHKSPASLFLAHCEVIWVYHPSQMIQTEVCLSSAECNSELNLKAPYWFDTLNSNTDIYFKKQQENMRIKT